MIPIMRLRTDQFGDNHFVWVQALVGAERVPEGSHRATREIFGTACASIWRKGLSLSDNCHHAGSDSHSPASCNLQIKGPDIDSRSTMRASKKL